MEYPTPSFGHESRTNLNYSGKVYDDRLGYSKLEASLRLEMTGWDTVNWKRP